MTEKKDLIQIIFLGEADCGKTSIIKQYHSGKFDEENIASMGLDFCKCKFASKSG